MDSERIEEVLSIPVSALWSPLNALWAKLAGFLPNLLGAVVILALGYVLSVALQRLSAALLRRVGLDAASSKIGIRGALDRAGIQKAASEIVGALIFWLLMLTFLISATDTLGLRNVSLTIDSLVRYLPNVIGAAIITVVGLLIAHFVRDVVRGATESLGLDYARGLANLAYGVLIVVIVSLAFSQLQIETGLFNRVVEIVLITTGVAVALALGLGTRDMAKQLVAGVYARDFLKPGTYVSVGENAGVLEEVGPVSARLKANDGRVIYVPNASFTEQAVSQNEPEQSQR